jgi:DNA repair protein RadD
MNNPINLRGYQMQAVEGIRESYKAGNKRTLLVMPTGLGKTETFIFMAMAAISKGKRVYFLVHKKNLVKQISERCKKYGLRHGFISGNRPKQYYLNAQVCSVQSLKNRLLEVPKPDWLIIDEAHHANAGTWRSILEFYGDTVHVLGVTATPWRGDGQGLGDVFYDMFLGPTPAEGVKLGALVMPEYYNFHPLANFDKIKKNKDGDYNTEQLFKEMDKPAITGNAVDEYRRLASGQPAIYSCVNIKHAENVAAAFRSVGYNATAVHGNLEDAEIEQAFRQLASGEIHVITFCDLISEGTDIPAVAVVGMLRRTMSLSLYLQIVGRGLRPCEGKDRCLILDHVGNQKMHGHPLQSREWSLDGLPKKKRGEVSDVETEYIDCTECLRTYLKSEPKCIYCGAKPEIKVQQIEEVAGVAVKDETTLEQLLQQRTERKSQEAQSKTLGDLYQLAKVRGYKPKWAFHRFESRVLKESGSIEYINKKYGLNAVNRDDLKSAVLRCWNNFIKNL